MPRRLTPSVLEDDIRKRNAPDRPEPSHRIADRQQRIGMDVRWQPKCRIDLLLEFQVERRQSGTEAVPQPLIACSEPQDRWIIPRCGSVSGLTGKGFLPFML